MGVLKTTLEEPEPEPTTTMMTGTGTGGNHHLGGLDGSVVGGGGVHPSDPHQHMDPPNHHHHHQMDVVEFANVAENTDAAEDIRRMAWSGAGEPIATAATVVLPPKERRSSAPPHLHPHVVSQPP